MRDLFQQQLQELNQELTEMAADCREIIRLAAMSLSEWDEELAAKAAHVGQRIDRRERTVETIATKLLLRQQPVARDLRQISSALKIITDLERIGDQAEDIVEIAPHLTRRPHQRFPRIREMASAAMSMVAGAAEAYVQQDVALAQAVLDHDDIVDDYFARVRAGIIDIIAKNPEDGDFALDLLMVAKYFERIGDHCTNVAEWVIYSVTGAYKTLD